MNRHSLILAIAAIALDTAALAAPLELRAGKPKLWEDDGTWSDEDDVAVSPSGNLQHRVALFTWSSPSKAGLAIYVGLIHNTAESNAQRGLGYGFRLGVAGTLSVADDGTVTAIEPDGTPRTFRPLPAGRFRAETSDTDVLTSSGATYLLRMRGGHRRIFERSASGAWLERARADRTGDAVGYTYDAQDRLVQVGDSAGRRARFTWTAGFLTQVEDPEGRLFTLTYDRGELVTVAGPGGASMRLAYDDTNQHLIIARSDWAGAVASTFGYSPDRRADSLALRDGMVKRFDYTGDRFAITDSLGRTQLLRFEDGAVVESVAPNGITRRYGRDDRRRMVQVVDGLGEVSTYAYDDNDDIITKTDVLGDLTTFGYDGRHNPIEVFTSDGQRIRRTFDAFDNETSVTNPLGERIERAHDASGNLIRVTDALGVVRFQATYDTRGHRLTETDETGRVTRYGYDRYGNQLSETTPEGMTMSRTASPLGTTLSVTDLTGRTLTVESDALGRPARVRLPNGGSRTLTWDFEGRLLTREDREGTVTRRTALTYDASGGIATARLNGVDLIVSPAQLAELPAAPAPRLIEGGAE